MKNNYHTHTFRCKHAGGTEVEYYPAYWEQFLRLIEPYPIEYMILGQHFLGNEIGQLGSQGFRLWTLTPSFARSLRKAADMLA